MNNLARDEFLTYYTEKLWDMIPSVYRHEDGLLEPPGTLRALVEVLAVEAARIRRSHDRLWEDQFIATCDDWAVPYIGDLVGTRLVSALNRRGRRVDVAKTIYYRRRKGTPRVLDELISDIAGWEGRVVESFRRLGRTRHRLDPPPVIDDQQFTDTFQGGWADLRSTRGSTLAGGPFDEFHHTVDMRQNHGGRRGRFNIPRLNFHLYRLPSFPLETVTPMDLGGGHFSFDPSGRKTPLFSIRSRDQDPDGRLPDREWDLPAPIRCRALSHETYKITASVLQELEDLGVLTDEQLEQLATLGSVLFRHRHSFRDGLRGLPGGSDLTDPSTFKALRRPCLTENCGKGSLVPRALELRVEGDSIHKSDIMAADLAGTPPPSSTARVLIDPENGQFFYPTDPPAEEDDHEVRYHYGFPGEIGAGSYERRQNLREDVDVIRTHDSKGERQTDGTWEFTDLVDPDEQCALTADDLLNNGVTQINDSATYCPVSDKLRVGNLTLQAANHQRPFLLLDREKFDHVGANWVLNTSDREDSELLLDGIWFGAETNERLIIRGDYERIVIRHCTMDPGGEDALGNPIPPVILWIEARVETLLIEDSICGPITVQEDGLVEQFIVRNTIVQSRSGDPALRIPAGEVQMDGVTVIGQARLHRLRASEVIFTEPVVVSDTQNGCFRFSAAPAGSRLPRPYESHQLSTSRPLFTSRRFGHPGYGQLSEAAPPEVLHGAENGSEMGAYTGRLNPIRKRSLHRKVEEYMPFGLIPHYIFET